jgi:hypothetical protein
MNKALWHESYNFVSCTWEHDKQVIYRFIDNTVSVLSLTWWRICLGGQSMRSPSHVSVSEADDKCFIAAHTTIPIPFVVDAIKVPTGAFIVNSRICGVGVDLSCAIAFSLIQSDRSQPSTTYITIFTNACTFKSL